MAEEPKKMGHIYKLFAILLYVSGLFLTNPCSTRCENIFYFHDSLNQLISVQHSIGIALSYETDLVGNRLAMNSVGINLNVPNISDSGAYTINSSKLDISVTVYDSKYGNLIYEFVLGTTAGGSEVVTWTIFEPLIDGSFSIKPLELAYNQQYFVSARVRNFTGDIVTAVGTSDGIIVLNPVADNDNDGASNQQELNAGTNPYNSDSDNDKIPDGWEIQNQLNPLSDDALSDKDDDGFSNLREFVSQSNPSDENDLPNCISDYDQDGDVDGYDLSMLIEELGRSDCTPEDPCTCDKYVDGSVNEIEFLFFREDFGRDECQ
jgi:hypothetical protein